MHNIVLLIFILLGSLRKGYLVFFKRDLFLEDSHDCIVITHM